MCGDQQGWVSHFWKDTRAHASCDKCRLTKPCAENCKCVVNADLTDFTCEAEPGFEYNVLTKKCTPPLSGGKTKGGVLYLVFLS